MPIKSYNASIICSISHCLNFFSEMVIENSLVKSDSNVVCSYHVKIEGSDL